MGETKDTVLPEAARVTTIAESFRIDLYSEDIVAIAVNGQICKTFKAPANGNLGCYFNKVRLQQ